MRTFYIAFLSSICLQIGILVPVHAQTSTDSSQVVTPDTTHPKSIAAKHTVLSDYMSRPRIVWHDIRESLYDGGQFFTRPLHWDLKEWAVLGVVAGLTVMFDKVDDPVARDYFEHHHNPIADKVVVFGNSFYGTGVATGL